MEGPRLPPSPFDDEDKPDDPPAVSHRPTSSLPGFPSSKSSPDQSSGHFRKYSLNFSPILTPPPADPTPELETYVIQLPKDQIYWVPPPEHSRIVEQHRINLGNGKDKPFCSKRLVWFFILLVVLGILAGAITLVIHFVFNPVLPAFTVEELSLTSPHKTFEITLKADNPTSKMRVNYVQEQNDGVSLTYKNKNLGRAKFPKLSQVAGGSDKVRLKLDRSKNTELPSSKQPVKVELKMGMKAEFGSGPVKKKRNVAVTCDIKVKGLETKKVQIVSQKCESEFKK